VGLGAVSLAVVIGTLLGLISGFAGKSLDLVIMFLMDILLAFPGLLLAIAVVALIGPGLFNSMLAISVVSIPVYARIARSTVLSLKEQEFVTAARCVGARSSRILFQHVFPNSLSPILVQGTLGIATAILEIAALGFLGLGQQPPYPEWGAMLADSVKYLTSGAWWVLLFPGFAIMLTVLGFNLLGDGLRDALDPRLRIA
jgi:peptide/nickel transport system permease protein